MSAPREFEAVTSAEVSASDAPANMFTKITAIYVTVAPTTVVTCAAVIFVEMSIAGVSEADTSVLQTSQLWRLSFLQMLVQALQLGIVPSYSLPVRGHTVAQPHGKSGTVYMWIEAAVTQVTSFDWLLYACWKHLQHD